ncbi:MAG: hypothetical protein Q4A16_02620 [Lautropia sp.]|nr:hypothetical protein [Lautropia sp.]
MKIFLNFDILSPKRYSKRTVCQPASGLAKILATTDRNIKLPSKKVFGCVGDGFVACFLLILYWPRNIRFDKPYRWWAYQPALLREVFAISQRYVDIMMIAFGKGTQLGYWIPWQPVRERAFRNTFLLQKI